MANPCCWVVCTICSAVHDAQTTTRAWFVNDSMIWPVRGNVCGACALVRHEQGLDPETINTRTPEAEVSE